MIDEQTVERDGFWEPWQPVVGQRVRVRLNAECRVKPEEDSPDSDLQIVGHHDDEDGSIGQIKAIFTEMESPLLVEQGHRFGVWWDGGMRKRGADWVLGNVYAAIELEPLDEEHADE